MEIFKYFFLAVVILFTLYVSLYEPARKIFGKILLRIFVLPPAFWTTFFVMVIEYTERMLKGQKYAKRQTIMLIQGLGSIAFLGMTLFLAYTEFGNEVFSNNLFWLFIAVWAYANFIVFLINWNNHSDDVIETKIDKVNNALDILKDTVNEFIRELRQDRDDRNKEHDNEV